MLSDFSSPPLAPCPDPFNLADYVLTAGRATPDKIALEICGPDGSESYTFGDIETLVIRIAAALGDQGVQPETRVLMRLGNDISFPITYLASLWLGAVPVPTSAQLTEAEVTRIADDVKPDLIVHDGLTALPPSGQKVSWDDLITARPDNRPKQFMSDPERLGYIIFTSGTTRGPRGVCHAHRAIWARRMMFTGWYGLDQTDRLLHAGAFNWTYTLGTGLMDPWTAGATALIPRRGTQSSDLLGLMRDHKATIFAAAPGVYRQILKSADAVDLPDLRHGLSAGEKLAPRIKARWREVTGVDIHEALGMSECSTFISGSPARPASDTAAGWPQAGRRIAVMGADMTPVPCNSPGILAVHKSDPGLALGYLDAPLTEGEWFLTGDTVSMDECGAISYLGRNDDMLNAGGFRVSPVEVEAAFIAFDGITEAAAIALSPKADTTVIALVYSAAEALPEDALCAHADALLARYKQPRLYIHRDVLPKGANGKLNRKALRAALEREHGQT